MSTPDYLVEDFRPIYGKSLEERRMRVHQQWWGWRRLHRPMGQLRPREPFPVLTAEEQRDPATSNFITEAIHAIATGTPGLSSQVHFNHLLSSMPMAINLFGFLIDPSKKMTAGTPLGSMFSRAPGTPYAPSLRAGEFIGRLLGRTVEVLRVDFEIPGRLYIDSAREHPLLDGTSLDVMVEYRDGAGLGLLAIETKLTEPLSNGGDLLSSTRNYQQLFDHPGSPFKGLMSGGLVARLTSETLVQWTRNHLLAFGMQRMGGYSSHAYWTVFPRSHVHASDAAQKYPTILADPSRTFAAFTLEDILAAWAPLLSSPEETGWLEPFRQRYLALDESEALWKALSARAKG